MRFVKVLASIVFSLIIIIALVGYFAVRNFDLNKYKSFATEMVEQQTGRHLAINGDARIGISLTPTVVLNDVELSRVGEESADAESKTVGSKICDNAVVKKTGGYRQG